MSESISDVPAALLAAAYFAAERHVGQKRKDGITPYINHPIAVAELLARIGGVTDTAILQAALLHDTIEDTNTTGEEIGRLFGQAVRGLVEEVTDDMSLPKKVRRERQLEHAPQLSPGAKQIKIADKACNFWDISPEGPTGWSRDVKAGYMEWGAQVVDACRGFNPPLEAYFDEVYQARKTVLGLH